MSNWQLPLVLLIVAVAAVYLVRQVWRGARSGCGGGCGCGKSAAPAPGGNVTLIPADQLKIRRPDADSA
jgi:hypothetical protein